MKKNGIFLGVLVLIICIQIIMLIFQEKDDLVVHTRNYMYMDTHMRINLFNIEKEEADKLLDGANEIFKDYHDLSTRFEANMHNNVYHINNNQEDSEYLVLDERLYSMISYGIDLYHESNGIKNINIGNVIDVWDSYRKNQNGVPTIEELTSAGSINIEDIVLLDGNRIKNNNPNIDLGSLAKGYAVQVVGDYFKENGANSFIINAGGNVLVGDHHSEDVFKIGLQDPNSISGIYHVVRGENIAVVTSGGYERFYEYDGKKYGHIIDTNTLFPAMGNKSVTIVTDDSKKADGLALTLFVMSPEEGIEYLKDFDNVEAIWYTSDDEVIKTEGFSKYES